MQTNFVQQKLIWLFLVSNQGPSGYEEELLALDLFEPAYQQWGKLLIIKNYKKCGFRNRVIFSYAQWMILQKRGYNMKKSFNPNCPQNFFESLYANLNVSNFLHFISQTLISF